MPADIIDSDDLISEFGDLYTITRRAAATYVNGIAVPGATTTLQTTAAFWPASGRDLQRLPEGRRSLATMAGVSTEKLVLGGQGGANEADLITIDGEPWEVQTVGTWPNNPRFYTVVVQRPNLG